MLPRRKITPVSNYHIIDFLVPPPFEDHITTQESLLRLENICACAVVRNRNNCQILSNTPSHLHKTLWKAYIKDEYYNNPVASEVGEGAFNPIIDLKELVYHWPLEEFNLKQLMPELPQSIECFSTEYWDVFEIGSGPFNHTKKGLLQFYTNVAERIFHIFIGSLFPDLNQHYHDIKIRKINLTGFHTFELGFENRNHYKTIPQNKDDKLLEIIFDANIHAGEYIEGVEDFNKLYHCHSKYYHSISYIFDRVSLTGPYETNDFKILLEKCVKEGANAFELEFVPSWVNRQFVVEEIFKTGDNKRNIVELELGGCEISSLNFLQYLSHLVHLDLSRNNLHGKLESVRHMNRGLLLLKLEYCQLKSTDLIHLSESCHTETLLELNLYNNFFNYNRNSDNYNLIGLCQNLRNIIILKCAYCCLGSWERAEIVVLVDSLKTLSNCILLDLRGNQFSTHTVSVHLRTLQDNPSLRYLQLSLPAEIAVSDTYNAFCKSINEEMNDKRSQLLYIEFSNDPAVVEFA